MASEALPALVARSALGLVETLGLIPAIIAADTAVKTAEVRLIGLEYIGSGLVSVKLLGDVSAVQVAVEAACLAAEQLGRVHSHTVIARTGEGLWQLLAEPACAEAQPGAETSEAGPQKGEDAGAFQAMTVSQLRRLARSKEGFPLSRQQIKFARKEELIELLVQYSQGLKNE